MSEARYWPRSSREQIKTIWRIICLGHVRETIEQERRANKDRLHVPSMCLPCAFHVPWTCRYLLAPAGTRLISNNIVWDDDHCAIDQIERPLSGSLSGLNLVAGARNHLYRTRTEWPPRFKRRSNGRRVELI